MRLKTKSILYQFICFATLFIAARLLLSSYADLSTIWLPIVSAIIATVLAPQFKVVQTKEGEQLMMRWIFIKGVKTLK